MEPTKDTQYMNKVNRHAARKLKAQKEVQRHVWLGLGMMGIIGWSVAIPTLLGLALGIWLDETYPGSYLWTLNLLLVGIIVGCGIAWHWVSKEYKAMNKDEEGNDDH